MSGKPQSLNPRFEEGADARLKGLLLADNPYAIRTSDHTEWAAGWCATCDLDEEDDPASDRDHMEEGEEE